jgi:hypothetical protein
MFHDMIIVVSDVGFHNFCDGLKFRGGHYLGKQTKLVIIPLHSLHLTPKQTPNDQVDILRTWIPWSRTILQSCSHTTLMVQIQSSPNK